jgi:hypothetical protein
MGGGKVNRKIISLILLQFMLLGNTQLILSSEFPACGHVSLGDQKAVGSLDLIMANLSARINSESIALQNLYYLWSQNKTTVLLKDIIRTEKELQDLKNQLETYKRANLSMTIMLNYTRSVNGRLEVLYYMIPSDYKIVEAYKQRINPVREDIDLDWLISYYQQASELTFDKILKIEYQLQGLTNNMSEISNVSSQKILTLLNEERMLWHRLNEYENEKTRLMMIRNLKSIGRKQILLTSHGISPMAVEFGGIRTGSSCSSWYCYNFYGKKPSLNQPGDNYGTAEFNVYPRAVWVGLYLSKEPRISTFWGEYCTYAFPSINDKNEIKSIYWTRAVELAAMHLGSYFKHSGSIQIKFLYGGQAKNQNTGKWQTSNLIFQYECNDETCWISGPRQPLPRYPSSPTQGTYYIFVWKDHLIGGCCKGGDDGGGSCFGAVWGNRHCGGCFAPDASASQNFAYRMP